MEATKSYVHLLGDSTLDNLIWIMSFTQEAPKNCVEGWLKGNLGENYTVVNHAYDGFTTSDVLNGGQVGAVLNGFAKLSEYLEQRTGGTEIKEVKPLDELRASIEQAKEADHYVAISVGGNDFRVKLLQPWALLGEISAVQKRYLQIVDQVQAMGGKNIKPILMFQYRTDLADQHYPIYKTFRRLGYVAAMLNTIAVGLIVYSTYQLIMCKIGRVAGFGKLFLGGAFLYASHKQLSLRVTKEIFSGKHAGLAVFGASLERLYAPIIERALNDCIPICDMANSIDPSNSKNYISDIEPSNLGGLLIAMQLTLIIKDNELKQRGNGHQP